MSAKELESVQSELASLQRRIRELEAEDFDLITAAEVLRRASQDERDSLRAILRMDSETDAAALIGLVRRAGSDEAARKFREWRGEDPDVSYDEVVRDVCSKVGAPAEGLLAAQERAAVYASFDELKGNFTPEALKKAMAEIPDLSDQQKRDLVAAASAGGAIALAQLSGLGVYIMASSVIGAMTSALGLTLPFAFYMTMSKTISVVIGPIGWAALGGWILHKLTGPNLRKTVPAVLLIAAVRSRLELKRRQELQGLRDERDRLFGACATEICVVGEVPNQGS